MKSAPDHIVVIGGGGAGLIAAWRAAVMGSAILLLEKNARIGSKILISGGGKCNITHNGSVQEVLSAFDLNERRFLKFAFHQFTPQDIQQLLATAGIACISRPNGRVFPVSGSAKDVVRALMHILASVGVVMRFHQRAEEILVDHGHVAGVRVGDAVYSSRRVILATGGLSYPKMGTTGDGYAMARVLGHTIVPLRPALAPMQIAPKLPGEWRGIAIRGGSLSLRQHGRTLARWEDDILVTHEGFSGPAPLELSRTAARACETGDVQLCVDFFPHREYQDLDLALRSMVEKQRGKMISTLLEAWLPNRLIDRLLQWAEVDPSKRGHSLTREERHAIIRLLKGWIAGTVCAIPLERGEVTAGGVALGEVDPVTMQSRLIGGLYLCGEVLDIAGPIGGYNLHAAFSTGFVAGDSAAKDQSPLPDRTS